jgi:hypothetical protein
MLAFASKNGWKLTKMETIPFENLSSIPVINELLNKLNSSNAQFIKSISQKSFLKGKIYQFIDSNWEKVEADVSKEAVGYIIVDKTNRVVSQFHFNNLCILER